MTTDAYAFVERLDTDPALDVGFVRERLARSGVETGAVVLGAFDPELCAIVGLHRVPQRRESVRLWGFYVEPEHRRRRIGHTLLTRAAATAAAMQGVEHVELTVSEQCAAAIRLYESVGFSTTRLLSRARGKAVYGDGGRAM